jgi:protein FAM50
MADTGSGASDKAAALAAAREKERAASDAKRAALAATAAAAASRVLSSNFAGAESAGAAAEAFLRERTIGLLTREEYAAARDEAKAKEVELRILGAPAAAAGGGGALRSWGGARAAAAGAAAAASSASAPPAAAAAAAAAAAGLKRSSRALLSFGAEEEEEEEEEEAAAAAAAAGEEAAGAAAEGAEGGSKRRCAAAAPALGKDPSVPTAFLPDAAREAREAAARAAAEAEWAALQERTKAQPLKVVYSYWDGTGHRRELSIPQGASIGRFLEAARGDLAKEFPELRAASASSLLYVKEDLIIPQHHTFYELISTQARGKSGPLFAFGVAEDVRLGALDSRVEKEDSHPGKILDARWYQRNKHIFPYSRWEVYQPGVARGKYTIG